jgi:hypothetical protein
MLSAIPCVALCDGCVSCWWRPLQVSMSAVGAMFLRNPSLLNKKPTSLAAKAAALRALPGLQPEQAAAAMAAMPSLLNLNPARLQDRWQRLQQVRQQQQARVKGQGAVGWGVATRTVVLTASPPSCSVGSGSAQRS